MTQVLLLAWITEKGSYSTSNLILNSLFFKKLQNKSVWQKATVKHGTVVWDNETDFDPDTLYLEGVPHSLQPIH